MENRIHHTPPEEEGCRKQSAPSWLSFEEVRQELRIGDKLLRREIRAGRIPATKVGSLWRINRTELERVLKERGA